ncbi:MAG: RDD family protein [Bacteroidota bacterium]
MRQLHGAELASFKLRAVALILDVVFATVLFVVVMAPFERYIIQGLFKVEFEFVFTFFGNWYSIVWLVLYFGLATYIGNGWTPGKWLVGIRVKSLLHERISLWHSLERALGYSASLLEFGFGFIQYFIHPNRRTAHDRIAETIVVREPRQKRRRK